MGRSGQSKSQSVMFRMLRAPERVKNQLERWAKHRECELLKINDLRLIYRSQQSEYISDNNIIEQKVLDCYIKKSIIDKIYEILNSNGQSNERN